MEKQQDDIYTTVRQDEEGNSDFLNSIDWDKLGSVFRRSLLWLIGILLLTNSLAYIYIRYTKPVYESYSDLKLDVKSEASLLEFSSLKENQNLNNLSGEIELIRSKLFFSKVIDAVDMDINYYAEGKINDEERYKNSPFEVRGKLKSDTYLDVPIKL